jgi:hypothetical protein
MLRRPVAIGPRQGQGRRHHVTLTFGRTEVSHPRAQGGAHSGTPRAHRREAVPKSGVDLCLSAAQRAAGSRCRRAGVLLCRARGRSSPGRQAAAPGRSLAVTASGTAPTASSTGPPRTAALSRPRRRLPLGDSACNADDRRSAPASRLILPDAYPKSRQPLSHQVASDQGSRTEERCWRAGLIIRRS